MSRSDRLPLLLLILAFAAMSLAVHPVGGFALNDDWVYALGVRSILETGRFALPLPATANVFAQAWWGALFCLPFGFSFSMLRLSTLALGLAGVLALHLLLRECGASRGRAWLGAAALGANPLYFGLAHSFMTDVPFLAVALLSLLGFVRGMRRAQAGWLAAGLALAFVALLIRQFAFALFAGYAVALLLRRGPGLRSALLALAPLAGAVALQLAYQHWIRATGRTPLLVLGSLADFHPLADWRQWRGIVARGVVAAPYVGLAVAPMLLAIRPPPRRGLPAAAALVVALLAGIAVIGAPMPEFGNVLIRSGFGPLTLRDTFLLGRNLPPSPPWLAVAWQALTVAGCIGFAVAALSLAGPAMAWARALRRPREWPAQWQAGLFLTVILAYAALLALVGMASTLFDRYLLLFGPAAFALLAPGGDAAPARPPAWGAAAAVALLAGMAAASVVVTHDYLAWNRARWTATRALTDAGVSPREIDGGYEFNGWTNSRADFRPLPGKSYWWVDDDRYVIASGPLDGYRETARQPFRHWLLGRDAAVVTLERLAPPQNSDAAAR